MGSSTPQLAPGPKTRRERVERREDAIVAAARSLFNKKGFSKTTIADIAGQSGVADGTVYLYFKNKHDVARAVLGDFYGQLTQSAQAGVDRLTTPQERLEFLARHHMRTVADNWRILEILPSLGHTLDDYEESDIYQLNRTYAAVFNRVVKDAQAQGQLARDIPLTMLRDFFYGSMEYGLRTLMMKDQENGIDEFVAGLMKLMFGREISQDQQPTDLKLASRLERAVERMETVLEQQKE